LKVKLLCGGEEEKVQADGARYDGAVEQIAQKALFSAGF
jgi:hypothetical protein